MFKCASYTLDHMENTDLRKFELNLCAVVTCSDNLNDQVDLFLKQCKRQF